MSAQYTIDELKKLYHRLLINIKLHMCIYLALMPVEIIMLKVI